MSFVSTIEKPASFTPRRPLAIIRIPSRPRCAPTRTIHFAFRFMFRFQCLYPDSATLNSVGIIILLLCRYEKKNLRTDNIMITVVKNYGIRVLYSNTRLPIVMTISLISDSQWRKGNKRDSD